MKKQKILQTVGILLILISLVFSVNSCSLEAKAEGVWVLKKWEKTIEGTTDHLIAADNWYYYFCFTKDNLVYNATQDLTSTDKRLLRYENIRSYGVLGKSIIIGYGKREFKINGKTAIYTYSYVDDKTSKTVNMKEYYEKVKSPSVKEIVDAPIKPSTP